MKKYTEIKREAKVLLFVWKMAKGEHGKIVANIFINLVSALLPAGIAYFIKRYIDFNALNFMIFFNQENLILFFSLIICGIFLKMTAGLIMGYAMPNVKRNIEISCINKFAKLPHFYISDCIDNRIIMSLSIESGMIANLIPMIYRSFIKAPITILGFVVLLLFVSPILTLICFVLMITVLIGVLLFRKSIKRLNEKSYNRIGDLHQYFAEWLAGYSVFFTSNATRFVKKQLNYVSTELAELNKKVDVIIGIMQKPENRFLKVLEIAGAVIAVLSLLGIIDIIRRW